uniref:RanBP2-type domain-containing protein n=1 Tax=Acrobeloides nanus TaxID=290746 RepID=A0A914C2X7_9BILA
MLAIILSKQGFKYSSIRIEPSKCLTTGKPCAIAIVQFVDPVSPLAWIQVNQGELKFDGGVFAKMEFSSTDRLDAIIDIRRNILEASARRQIESDPTSRSFDQLFEDHRSRREGDRGAASSKDLSNWARHKERDDRYRRDEGPNRISHYDEGKSRDYRRQYRREDSEVITRKHYDDEARYGHSSDRYDSVEQEHYSHPDSVYEHEFKRRKMEYDRAMSPKDEYYYEDRRRRSEYEESSYLRPSSSSHHQENLESDNYSIRCWTCHQCNNINAKDFDVCSTCGLLKKDSEAKEARGNHLIGLIPCDKLPYNVDEASIRAALNKYSVELQRIRLADSKQYCLVQLRSVEDSIYLLKALNSSIPYINNCAVIVSFSLQSLNQIVHEEIKAAQSFQHLLIPGTEIGRSKRAKTSGETLKPNLGVVKTPIGLLPVFPKPIPENFQFESESGYWYDPISGFYYDKESGYYYVLEENSWKFWSSKYQTYIPCEGIDDSRRRLFEDDHHDDYSRKADDPYLVHETRSSLKSYSPPISSKKESTLTGSTFDMMRTVMEQNKVLKNMLKNETPTTDPYEMSSSKMRYNPREPPPFEGPPPPLKPGMFREQFSSENTRNRRSLSPQPELPPMTVEYALAEAARRQKVGKLTRTCQLCNSPLHKIRECWAPIVCARCGQFNHMHKECVHPPASIAFINSQIVNQQQMVARGIQQRGETQPQLMESSLKSHAPTLVSVSANESCLNCGEGHRWELCPLPVLCVNCGSRKHLHFACGAVIASPETTQQFVKMRTKLIEEAKAQIEKTNQPKSSKELKKAQAQPSQKEIFCLNCRSTKHVIKNCTMPFVRSDILTGEDSLSQQLKKVQEQQVVNTDLMLCLNCSQIGHHRTVCTNEKVDKSNVDHMKELIILYKHQRKMQIKESSQNDEMPNEDDLEVVDELYEVSDDDESNEKPEELVKGMPGNNSKNSEKANKSTKRRLRRQKLEESIKDAKETTTRLWDFGDLPDSKSCLNCNSEKHKIDNCTMPLLNPDLNGDDLLSIVLKQFYPDNCPRLAQLHELYTKNFCKNCAEFGHIDTTCSNPKADPSKLVQMHQLVLLYAHMKKMEKNEQPFDPNCAKRSRNSSENLVPTSPVDNNPSLQEIEISDISLPSVTAQQSEISFPKPSKRNVACINCMQIGHTIEDCTSTTINDEVNGSDAFSRSLRTLVPDGNIKNHHLE